MVAALPIAKLGALLIKQISKPIASLVKQRAKNSPIIRKYVCLPPAQFYNWCEVKMKMFILKSGKPVQITVLSEEDAIELGSNLLGEGIIFIIAAAILVSEYNRSAKKEAAKEQAKRQEMAELQKTLMHLFLQTEEQGAHIRELSRRISDLESRVVQKPWVTKKTPKDSEQPPREPSLPSPSLPPFLTKPLLEEESEVEPDSSDVDEAILPNSVNKDNKSIIMQAVNEIGSQFLCKENKSKCREGQGLLITTLNQLFYDDRRIIGLKL